MTAIRELFQQAEMSEGAYANFIDPQTGVVFADSEKIKAALQDVQNKMFFSDAQATAFVQQWSVVDQLPDTGSGFSGTVFQNKATREYSFARAGALKLVNPQ